VGEITKVILIRTIPVGQFLNDKIGMEMSISGDESPEEQLSLLKKRIDEWHRKEYPHIYQEETYPQSFPNPNRFERITDSKEPMTVIYEKGPIAIATDNTLEAIKTAPTLEILKSFKIIASSDPSKVLYNAYNKRLKELVS